MNQPALYSSASALQRRDSEVVLRKYLDSMEWGTGETVLDIGCGTGDTTASLLLPCLPSSFGRLVGVDMSSAMVKHAIATHRHPRLTFIQEDISTEKLRDTTLWREAGSGFHKVFSFFCLHWVQKQRKALTNIYELLRPEGEALLVFLSHCAVFSVYEKLAQKNQWQQYMHDYQQFLSPYCQSPDPVAQFNDYLREAGFQILDCQALNCYYDFPNMEDLTEMLKAVNPFLQRMPANLQAEYMMDLVCEVKLVARSSGMEANNNANDKKIGAPYRLLVAHVKK